MLFFWTKQMMFFLVTKITDLTKFPNSKIISPPMAHPKTPLCKIKTLNQITVDYKPEACTHSPDSDSITVVYDARGGTWWRSTTRFKYGTFSSKIQCLEGNNTSGLNFNIYLFSLERDKSQDEIEFEFLGKDKTIVQTNYYTSGKPLYGSVLDYSYEIFLSHFLCHTK